MPISPARFTTYQAVGVRFADFAEDGSGSFLDRAFSVHRVKLKNDSGFSITFTLEQGNPLGGWAVFERTDLADGAESEIRFPMPGLSPTGAAFRVMTSEDANPGYEATVLYTPLTSVAYSTP